MVTTKLEEEIEDTHNMQQEDNTSTAFANISVQPWKAEDDNLKEYLKDVVGGKFNRSRKIWLTLAQHRDEKGLRKFISHPVNKQWQYMKETNKLNYGRRDLVWSCIDANENNHVGEGTTT